VQASSQAALDKGVSLKKIFGYVSKIRKNSDIPVILMSYLNPIYHLGIKKAAVLAKKSGVDGFIIPDIIPEEAVDINKVLKQNDLKLIFLAAPNTVSKRLRYIDKKSSPFVYMVSVTGVTGGRKHLSPQVATYLKTSRNNIKRNPRFLGFGISSSQQVKYLKKYADGFIVGSALIDLISKYKNRGARNKQIADFARSLRKALDN
jgi:tryptophan synthase alpha chain